MVYVPTLAAAMAFAADLVALPDRADREIGSVYIQKIETVPITPAGLCKVISRKGWIRQPTIVWREGYGAAPTEA